MKVKILLVLMGSILFLQGCASTVKMAAVTASDQKEGYDGTITSQKKHFISISPYTQLKVAKDKTLFMVGVQNCGKEPINISNNNVSVIFEGNNNKDWASKRINIQSVDDFMNDLEKEYTNTEKKFIYSTLENIKLDSESSSSSSSSSSSDSFDSVETKIKDLNNDIITMRDSNDQLRSALQEIVVKSEPQAIMPGDTYSGIMVCDTRDMNKEVEGNFKVVVSVDSEKYNFTFKRSIDK
jgi:hypothetical protein